MQKSHTELASKVSSLETTVSENGEQLARVTDEANYCSEGIADLTENLQVTNDDLAATQKSVEENARGITSIKAKTDCPRIAIEIVDGKLHVYNASYYTKNGYYPFVFRFTSKRNRCTLENYPDRKRDAKNKGWQTKGTVLLQSHSPFHDEALALTSPPPDFLFSSIHPKPTNPPSHPK